MIGVTFWKVQGLDGWAQRQLYAFPKFYGKQSNGFPYCGSILSPGAMILIKLDFALCQEAFK
jgi:hypothetical protein